jgi:hypothetical protein
MTHVTACLSRFFHKVMKPSFKQSFKIKKFLLIHLKTPPGKFRLPKRRRGLLISNYHIIIYFFKRNQMINEVAVDLTEISESTMLLY